MRKSAFFAAVGLIAAAPAFAETGITDKEIKIGQTMPYSGPASAYGAAGTFVVFLVWVYYTTATLLISYEFATHVIIKRVPARR